MMAADTLHLKYVGYIIDVLRRSDNNAIFVEQLPDLLKKHFNVTATIENIQAALDTLSPLVVETKRGLRLAPRLLTENRFHFYSARARLNPAPKRAVAMHIYKYLLDELDSVFMDAGSANGAVAEEMAYGEKRNFTVLTNNVRAIQAFLANSTIRVFVTGGVYDLADEALLGRRAQFEWKEFGCKTALVGASALSARYVFNHGLTGEELLKTHYWQIPADRLVVPASLDKFKGQDASCFGRLFHEPDKASNPVVSAPTDSSNIDVIGKATYDDWRATPFVEYDAPGFRARSCTIVIEPEWMIKLMYPDDEAREELMNQISLIKGDRTKTRVDVVHAQISREELLKDYPGLLQYLGSAG